MSRPFSLRGRPAILAALIVLFLVVVPPVLAGPPVLLADINKEPGTRESYPRSFVRFGNQLYFLAMDRDHGLELWRTDGTRKGTELFTEILPGPGPDQPFHTADANYMAVAGGWLYFRAWDPAHGEELWRTDGTIGGTSLFADIRPGPASSGPKDLVGTPTGLYFVASDAEHGAEPWRVHDGVVEPIDVVPGTAGSSPQYLTPVGERAFFLSYASGAQRLWTTDGTVAGTKQVEGAPANPETPLTSAMGKLFFTIYKPTVNTLRELWVVDGATLAAGSLGEYANVEFDRNPGTPVHFATGGALWRTDGSPQGTTRVFDGQGGYVQYPLSVGTAVYARGYLPSSGYELWRIDGSEAALIDVAKGEMSSSAYPLAAAGGGVYFSTHLGSPALRTISWTDGTVVQTLGEFPGDYNSIGPGGGLVLGDRYVFLIDDGTHGVEPWVSGVSAGVASPAEMLEDVRSEPHGSDPSRAVSLRVGDKLWAFFAACETAQRCGVWRTDGDTTIPDDPARALLFARELTPFREKLYFVGGTYSARLYWTDGTTGAHEVQLPTAYSEAPGSLAAAGANLFFSFNRGLWRLDPQDPSGVLPVWSPSYGGVSNLVPVGDSLYFSGWDFAGESVFRTDGTTVTRLEPDGADLYVNPYYLTPVETRLGTRVFFYANAPLSSGAELWATDGTVTGTALVRDINTASDPQYPSYPGSSRPYRLTAVGDTLFFTAWEPERGRELWKSDGTAAGTVLVKDITDEPMTEPVGDYATSTTYREMVAAGRTLFFTTWTADLGTELWKSDGTEAGTTIVRDIVPGPGSASPGELMANGRTALFAAWDPDHGRELWQTDGTEAGTARVTDIVPDEGSSSPSPLSLTGGALLFSATTDAVGREPWRMTLPQVAIAPVAAVKEGDTAPVVASATDPDGTGLTFHWDMDGDGAYELDTLGDPTATFSAAGLDGPGVALVRVRATDARGLAAADEVAISLLNVAPSVEAGPPATIVVGQQLGRQVTFTDPGADMWTATVDYGDGMGEHALGAVDTAFTVSHSFAARGTYTVTVRVADDDGGVGTDSFLVTVGTARDLTADLIDEIEDLVDDGTLNGGQGHSLLTKLRQALAALDAGDEGKALPRLDSFIHEVTAFKNAGILDASKADGLVATARAAIDSISG